MPGFAKEPQRSYALGLLCAGLVLFSYWLLWGSVEAFVKAIDHDEAIFSDFQRFYYPMGEVLFAERWPVQGYYYTSFFALGLSLVALLPPAVATFAWGALQVGLAAAFCYVPARWLLGLSPRGAVPYLLLFLTSFPLVHNFKWGQVSTLVALGIALAFVLQQRGWSAWGGVVLAAVTSIKYYPGIFIVYFLIRRDRRFIIAFGAGLVGCYYALPALLLGPVDWWHFEMASLGSLPGAALLLDDFNTQYFPHVINRLGFPLGYSLAASTIDFLRWLGLLIFCANCVLVGWLQRREDPNATALSATALFLSLPFVVQTSWPHYFVYLPFCQTALWLGSGATQISAGLRRLLRIPLLFSIALANIYFFNLLPSWRLYNGLGMLFFADASLLFALYCTAALWRSKRK